MDLSVGQAKLKKGFRNLLIRWEETKPKWNDSARDDFERNHLEPLEPRVRAALAAMDRLGAIMTQVRHDCQ